MSSPTDPQDLAEALERIERAKKILSTWSSAGRLLPQDVERVLNGDYNFYAVFKEGADFAGATSKAYVVLSGVKSASTARRLADEMIGKGNYILRKESTFDPANYPDGQLASYDAETKEWVA